MVSLFAPAPVREWAPITGDDVANGAAADDEAASTANGGGKCANASAEEVAANLGDEREERGKGKFGRRRTRDGVRGMNRCDSK